jgi:hypothetical protein
VSPGLAPEIAELTVGAEQSLGPTVIVLARELSTQSKGKKKKNKDRIFDRLIILSSH